MELCKVFVPVGAIGGGIEEDAFEQGMALKPDIISADAGSTDSGPYYLGTAKTKYARLSLKNDLKLMVVGAVKNHIPVTIGSCGTCGTDNNVDLYEDICKEILAEEGLTAKIAKIYTQQDPKVLKQKYSEGKINALGGAPEIDENTFESCTNIVAIAGVEPFRMALEAGADIVLCGRATDTAVIAAYPIMKGVEPGIAWHAAKLAECGAVCTKNANVGGVFLTFDEDSVIVQATAKGNSCSVYSVSSHLLYENADPICLIEPGCMIDCSQAVYEQLEEGRVRVSGTIYKQMPYTLKLEGARHAGYQTFTLVGVRDRQIMQNPEKWLKALEAYVKIKLKKLNFDPSKYSYLLRAYGWNAVYGGAVPEGYVPNEIGVLLTVTAETQELATQVAKVFNPYLLHFPLDASKPMPSFAFPFSPAETERGGLYEFTLYHTVSVDDPMELIRIVL